MSGAVFGTATSPRFTRTGLLLPLILLGTFLVLPSLAGAQATYALSLFERIMILGIAALGLDLITGYGGMVSFGQAAFIGLGAYATAILAFHGIGDATVALPASLAVAALFAAVTGIVSIRTRGVHFIMITLAFGQMAYFTAASLTVYGGDDGITLNARSMVVGYPLFASERVFYYFTLVCVVGTYLLCRALIRSRFGRVLRGIKENPMRVASLGFEVFRYRLVAYVISGAIGGLAGFLLANSTSFVSPSYMSWQQSGELLVFVLVGGMGTLDGAIVGAIACILLSEYLSQLIENWQMIFGPLLILVVLFARGGLMGIVKTLSRRPA